MSDITREKALVLAKDSRISGMWPVTVDELIALSNAVRADFIKELLGMDVEPVAWQSMHAGIPVSVTGWATEAEKWRGNGVHVRDLITTTQAAALVLQEREKLERNERKLAQAIRQASSALRKHAVLPWGTPEFPVPTPGADLLYEARSHLVAAIRNRKEQTP